MARIPDLRSAIAVHHTATTDVAWDGGEMVKRCKANETELKLLHAWRSYDGDPNVKSSYKLPHHMVSGDGQVHAANIKACQSIIGVLNGARGGADIPDSDVQGVYNHAAAHLKDAGLEPAELKRSAEEPRRIERREVTEFRVRRQEDGKAAGLAGLAAPYNKETVIGTPFGSFREVLRSGIFTRALNEKQDVVCWYQHGMGAPLPLGRTSANTLRLKETAQGLEFDCDLPDTQDARDLAVSIDRGDVNKMSFAFAASPDGENWDDSEIKAGKLPLREVTDADISDVSPVVFAAYPQTSVGIRSVADVFQRYLDSRQGAGSPSEANDAKPEAGLEVERARIELERRRFTDT
ncbi:MAG: HK97 family phage prohead protease [Thermoanaerobaculaceae bacterium]|jgi:hypothetical protein